MKFRVVLFGLLCCCCLAGGCIGRSFDDGNSVSIIEPEKGVEVPALNISEPTPTTDATALSAQVVETLAHLLATRGIRARTAQRTPLAADLTLPTASGTLPTASLPTQLPNFENALISLTPSLSPVLQSYASGLKIETIPDIQAFMTTYGLSSASLQTAIKQAKAIAVNLNGLPSGQASNNPLFQAALREAVPIIFENPDALTDFTNGWTQGVSIPGAERMAKALGVGIESQIAVAIPATDSATTELILLGANALSRTTDVSSAWAKGTPPDPDGEIPEAEKPSPGAAILPLSGSSMFSTSSTPASPTDISLIRPATFVNDRPLSNGIPASGELPANEFVSFRLYPAGDDRWKPHDKQSCYNQVVYHVQLRYVPAQNKKYLRIFTERGFLTGGMAWDGRKDRGYFQYSCDIRIEPVNSKDSYEAPSWLALYQSQPESGQIPPDAVDLPKYVSTTDLGNGQYPRDTAHNEARYRGMKIEKFSGAVRGKWGFRMPLAADPTKESARQWRREGPSDSMWVDQLNGLRRFKTIDNWKDLFHIESGIEDTIKAPPRWAIDWFNPMCQVVFSTTGDQTGSCRFKMTNIQRVRDVWRTAWRGSDDDTFHHAEAESGKFRHVTIDFGKVYPAGN